MNIPDRLKLVSVAQMQRIEENADAAGHSYAAMMEQAGAAVAKAIQHEFALNAPPTLVLAGPGNNGGDGLVCARYLHQAGARTRVYLWKRRTDPEHDYENHYARLLERGVETFHVDDDPELATLSAWLAEAEVVVDAMLGTGSNRPIEGQLAHILDRVAEEQQSRPLFCVGVDCSSGLNCDTGAIDLHALHVDLTVTFAYAKHGHYKFPGTAQSGRIQVADIGVDPHHAADIYTVLLHTNWVKQLAPDRSGNSHKGSFGKVMAAVGSMNYAGAAYLSCAAAGRVGAGLITGAIPQPIWGPIASKLTEATWLPLPSTEQGQFDATAAASLHAELEGYDALLVGCGLGQSDSTRDFLRNLLDSDPLPPTLIDADGLNCMAPLDNWLARLPEQVILTPHPAEMARLCDVAVSDVTARRWELAQQKAAEWGAVVLVKGPYTVIAEPAGALAVLPVATPALATAGTGDVLSGAITGLLAQGLEPFAAACLGAWIHGKAGELCQRAIGRAGTLASDVLMRLPEALRTLH